MKINSILIGKGRGSAGNVTVTQLKGQTILKQKATIVANPRTEPQMIQRRMMNRSVYVWQLFGNSLKQGFTSLLPFCSQYNTFVSVNSGIFVASTFSKENFIMSNLVGSIASKGALGTLDYTKDDIDAGNIAVQFSKANLNQIAKIGDKLVCVAGAPNASESGYSEFIVDSALLANNTPIVLFADVLKVTDDAAVTTVFLVSADGTKSTSSNWKLL